MHTLKYMRLKISLNPRSSVRLFPAHGATWSIQPSLSHLSSFTGGSAAGLSLKGTRTDNASNISIGTFLENNGGDINDILNDFGVGS